MINTDGSYPVTGRSIVYRGAAFHHLADMAWRKKLPGLADAYITTGSLYLCSDLLLPLGVPATDEFWSASPEPWTARKIWSGMDIPGDHSID